MKDDSWLTRPLGEIGQEFLPVRYPTIKPPPAISQDPWGDSDEYDSDREHEADDNSLGTAKWT
jgi:hypothetical protein